MPLELETEVSPSPPPPNAPREASTLPSEGPSSAPSDPSKLPPAALELAAKLFDLARTGDTETLRAYLQADVPKDLTNAQGDTLLMLAAYYGNAETAKMLLDEGADPNVLNGKGQSIIAGAVFKGWDDVVKVLFEGGADVWAGHPHAMDCARMFRREEIVKSFGVEERKMEGRRVRVDSEANHK